MTNGLALRVIAALIAARRHRAAQDAAVKKGEQVYAAQKCSVCHSIAGKGSKASPLDGVGAKLSAADIREWIVEPVVMATASTSSTKKPPMPNEVRQAAGG